MLPSVSFRRGEPRDASDLAILFDAASRRICAWDWSTLAEPGQSWLEVGRDHIRKESESKSHHLNWQVAEVEGQIAGAFFGFSLPDPIVPKDLAALPSLFVPMIEMEWTAKGCWLLQAIALFPEHRGRGLGPALMARACEVARDAGHGRVALQVESPNTGALAMYRKCGFFEWERRPYVPFPGSDDSGDWILMARDL